MEPIERTAAARRTNDRQGNNDRERDDLGQDHEFQRDRKPLGNRLQYGLSGAERSAQIALEDRPGPAAPCRRVSVAMQERAQGWIHDTPDRPLGGDGRGLCRILPTHVLVDRYPSGIRRSWERRGARNSAASRQLRSTCSEARNHSTPVLVSERCGHPLMDGACAVRS